MDFFDNVKPGSRVHYMTPQGQTRSGTVVINKGTHLVLNRGGGQPQVVTKDNYVKHSEGGKVKGALLSRVAKSMKEAAYHDNPNTQFFVSKLKHGALVMNDRGDIHDHYDDHEEAQKVADKLNNDYGVRRWNKKRAAREANEETELNEISSKLAKSYLKKTDPNTKGAKEIDAHLDAVMKGDTKMDPDISRKAFNRVQGRAAARSRKGLRGALRSRAIELGKQHFIHRDKFNKEEAELNELETSTLKSYGRKALKDLGKQVKRGRTAWDKHVATNMFPDPGKAFDVVIDSERKLKARKAGIKRLAAQMKARGETSVNEAESASLTAVKTAIAYETTKKKKKKKKQVLKPGKASKSSVRPTNEAKSEITGREMAEYIPDGQGKYKVNYIYPDKSKKENDRFETRSKAEKYAASLKSKGYHDVHIGEAKEDLPFDPDPPQKNPGVVKGKRPIEYSIVRHLARMERDKQAKKSKQNEGYNANETEHSGAKKGKGAYYGRKQDAKKESNKKRREADRKETMDEGLGSAVDKLVTKMADRSDARYQKKMDKIAKARYGKSWTEAGMRAPRKIDPQHQRYPDGSGPSNESADCNFYNRLDEVSKDMLARYIQRASRQAADQQYSAGHAYGSTMQAHKSAAKLGYDRPRKFAGKRRAAAYDAADKVEAPHMEKSRKRLKGISKALDKLRGDDRYAYIPATNEETVNEVSKSLVANYIKKATVVNAQDAAAGPKFSGRLVRNKSNNTSRIDYRQTGGSASRRRNDKINLAVNKLAGGAKVPATNEARESEYMANLALSATARRKPGHYLVKNGQHISGPHDPQGALNKYKDMSDNTGVKIVHIKEANKLQADVKKAGSAVQKAIQAAKAKKKGKTANVDPELETPNRATSQPMLQGPEGASDNANI